MSIEIASIYRLVSSAKRHEFIYLFFLIYKYLFKQLVQMPLCRSMLVKKNFFFAIVFLGLSSPFLHFKLIHRKILERKRKATAYKTLCSKQ